MKTETTSKVRAVLKQKKEGQIVITPRLTEKATRIAEQNTYTFNIAQNATKTQVKEAIKAVYGVTPIAVNVVKQKQETVFLRGKKGLKAGYKKAYVTLKKGDVITLM
jgi:large subunit ribosomal protein L23